MKAKGLRHAGIITKNPEKMINFYIEVLHLNRVWDKKENVKDITGFDHECRTIKLASENGSQIELIVPPFEPSKSISQYLDIGISHTAITVEGMTEIYDKVKELGCEMLTGDVFTNPAGIKIFFCKDPDGNILELVEDPKEE